MKSLKRFGQMRCEQRFSQPMMSDVRLALADTDHRIVKTVPRRGYMFAAEVSKPTAITAALPFPDRPSIAVLPLTIAAATLSRRSRRTASLRISSLAFPNCWPVRDRAGSAFRYRPQTSTCGRSGASSGCAISSSAAFGGMLSASGHRWLVDAQDATQLWAEY